jgi:hypothetical protein
MSMCSVEPFDKLDVVEQRARQCHLPFGGLQIICCDDFFQLSPVFNNKDGLELFPDGVHIS